MAGDSPISLHDIEVKVLEAGDVRLMQELILLFGKAFDDPDHYLSNPPTADYLIGLLDSPMFIAVVAMQHQLVVGGLAAYFLPKFEQARNEIYIYDLAVDSLYRRRGVATRLIERLRVVAKERNAWVIYVQADRDDDPAIKLYSRLGTKEEVFHFDIAPHT